ncbi:MAG: hypothetical protein PUB24_06215 [Lachnospiraceae bacterium]|nr:hypothetical protein [Mogibacterium kristiansenii]MDD6192655.1 hypothetical protein [Lachnospiraceae bacterium]
MRRDNLMIIEVILVMALIMAFFICFDDIQAVLTRFMAEQVDVFIEQLLR